jgi:hypothetical protein
MRRTSGSQAAQAMKFYLALQHAQTRAGAWECRVEATQRGESFVVARRLLHRKGFSVN